jgi:SAM-dependent methyltransferase
MLITNVIKSILKPSAASAIRISQDTGPTSAVLNVGGGNKSIQIPAHYLNWRHLLLDIDPGGDADIILDARKLKTLPKEQFDAVYCSHNLEHYFRHDVATVLKGFSHVLKNDGFAEIHVPNMRSVLKHFIESDMEIDGILYESPSGPISVLDVIYGWGKQIESTGVDFYAHKTGFTENTLTAALKIAGFPHVWVSESIESFSLGALAFKKQPTPSQLSLLGL